MHMRIFLILSLFCHQLITLSAELKHRNKLDQQIFTQSIEHACFLRLNDKNNKASGQLVQLLMYMHPEKSNEIAKNVAYNKSYQNSHQKNHKTSLPELLHQRSMELKNQYISAYLAFNLISSRIDPQHSKSIAVINTARSLNQNLDLKALLKSSPKLELYDPVKEGIEKRQEDQEEEARKKSYEKEANKRTSSLTRSDILKILKATRFKKFTYSDEGALHAFNILQHRLAWRDVIFKMICKKRFSIMKTIKDQHGNEYHYGPFEQQQFPATYTLWNVNALQVLDHMASNLHVKHQARDGFLYIYDNDIKLTPAWGEDGIALSSVYGDFFARVNNRQKYKGKTIRFNAYAIGYSDKNFGKTYLVAESGKCWVYINQGDALDQPLERFLKKFSRYEKKKEEERKKKKEDDDKDKDEDKDPTKDKADSNRQAKKDFVENSDLLLRPNFKGIHIIGEGEIDNEGMDILVIKKLKYLYIKDTGEYIIKK